MSRILTPRPDPADDTYVSRVIMTVGTTRFELIRTAEVREITRGPAEVIEMPQTEKETDNGDGN